MSHELDRIPRPLGVRDLLRSFAVTCIWVLCPGQALGSLCARGPAYAILVPVGEVERPFLTIGAVAANRGIGTGLYLEFAVIERDVLYGEELP